MKKISYSKILTIQIVLNIVFTLLIFNQIGIFFFIFQEIILILVLFLKKKNIYLSVVFLPFIFMYTYGLILYTIAQTNLKLTLPIYI